MPNRHSNRALIALGAFLCVLASVGLALMVTIARAHSSDGGMTYSAFCCTGDAATGDCFEVPDSTVKPIEGGWRVTLRKGQHRMVTSPVVEHFVPYGTEKKATDGKYHVCLFPNEKTMRCFYAPGMGF
jgi:hypothetical protein